MPTPEEIWKRVDRDPNDGYHLLINAKEKMRSPRRAQYFYNILFLIALSLILYLFSSQLLSQNGGGDGGGGGSTNSNDNSQVSASNVVFSNSNNHAAIISSLSNDFNNQKTGQFSKGTDGSSKNDNVNFINIDNNDDDSDNARGDDDFEGGAKGEVQRVVFGNKGTYYSVPTSGSTTLANNNNGEDSETTKDWLKMFSETARKVYAMFSTDYLNEFRKWAVKQQRDAIEREMKGYKFQTGKNVKLKDLTMEKGGQPIRNVIFTTWRSGSTFLGETLDSHPGTFYHYEPLLHFEIKQVRSGNLAEEGLRVFTQLLNCNYTGLKDYMEWGKNHHWLYSHNTRVWQYCEKSYDVCWDAKFLSDMCKLFPFQSVKTVRMRLRLAKTLLDNKKFNIRLLFLVRDPRGTMQSRNHRDWCPLDPDCYDPSKLCTDMEDDYHYAEKLRKEYPDRFLPIRYEDMSLSPYEAMQKIFKFFRLQYHPQVEKFLSSHTVANAGGVSSTFRDSKTTPFHWRNDFVGNFSLVTDIQASCETAMKLWGYTTVTDETELLSFNPLRRPPWSEMLVLNSTTAHDEIYAN